MYCTLFVFLVWGSGVSRAGEARHLAYMITRVVRVNIPTGRAHHARLYPVQHRRCLERTVQDTMPRK